MSAAMATFTKLLENALSLSPRLYQLYRLYYIKMVKKEVDLADISNEDTVLCIGGGPLPCTALEIAYQTGAKVKVIDNDPSAVRKARQFVEKLEMSHCVEVTLASGQEVDVSPFSVIHVAFQVLPRKAILNHVWKRAPQGARILVRSSYWRLHQMLDFVKMMKGKSEKAVQSHGNMRSTLLITKNWGNNGGQKNDFVPDGFTSRVNTVAG